MLHIRPYLFKHQVKWSVTIWLNWLNFQKTVLVIKVNQRYHFPLKHVTVVRPLGSHSIRSDYNFFNKGVYFCMFGSHPSKTLTICAASFTSIKSEFTYIGISLSIGQFLQWKTILSCWEMWERNLWKLPITEPHLQAVQTQATPLRPQKVFVHFLKQLKEKSLGDDFKKQKILLQLSQPKKMKYY